MKSLVCFSAWFVFVTSYTVSVGCYRLPSTCLEVKSYLPNSPDGEFWLDLFRNNTKYRVYCHNLTSENPEEFLTLNYSENNFAYSEKERVDSGYNPATPDGCSYNNNRLLFHGGGQTVYYKVKLQVTLGSLTIDTEDTTFGVTDADSFVAYVPYASPESCYDFGQPGKGRFSVDLRGTGMTVSELTSWKADGYASQMSDYQKQFDGQVVTATCGGWVGGCLPDPDFYLELLQSDVVAEESAESIWIFREMATKFVTCAGSCDTIETCLRAEAAHANSYDELADRALRRAFICRA